MYIHYRQKRESIAYKSMRPIVAVGLTVVVGLLSSHCLYYLYLLYYIISSILSMQYVLSCIHTLHYILILYHVSILCYTLYTLFRTVPNNPITQYISSIKSTPKNKSKNFCKNLLTSGAASDIIQASSRARATEREQLSGYQYRVNIKLKKVLTKRQSSDIIQTSSDGQNSTGTVSSC